MSFSRIGALKKILQCSECGSCLKKYGHDFLCSQCNIKILRNGKAFIFHSKSLIKNYDKPDYSSSNGYHLPSLNLIKKYPKGIILDYGAGNQSVNYPNVVQIDISLYPHTDIVVGEQSKLPFKDNSIDGAISLAVLEHVKDPFFYVNEIYRVLKPGGTCILDTAFLQPLHASPYHYFNTTHHAVALLFEKFNIQELTVGPHQRPWLMLKWIISSYLNGIKSEEDKQRFRELTVDEIEKRLKNILLIGEKLRKENSSDSDFFYKTWHFNAFPEESKFLVDLKPEAETELAAGFHIIAKKHTKK